MTGEEMEEKFRLIQGVRINKEKLQLAKEFRQDMTRVEDILWNELRDNQLGGYHFRRQQVIAGFIVDFYCHKARLIVEVDGEIHECLWKRDRARERILMGKGLRIIRFKNDEVFNHLSKVLATILNACDAYS